MIDRIKQYLEERMLFVDELGMPVVSCAGSHFVQLQQTESPFYYFSGEYERINTACVALAPTGCAKTHPQKVIIKILPVPSSKMAMLTSAGLLGSKDQEGRIHEGLAKELGKGILIVNELSTLVAEKQKEETQMLLNNVMEILSEGKFEKRLGALHLKVDTDMSLWGCIQLSNKRFDFTGGLARRAQFIFKRWTMKDLKKIVMNRHMFQGIKPDTLIAKEIMDFVNGRKIREIQWDEKLLKWIENRSYTSNNQIKLEKAAIGLAFWYPYEAGSTCLNIRKDDTIIKHLSTIERMWSDVCADPEIVLSQSLIGSKGLRIEVFYKVFGDLGYTRIATSDMLKKMSIAGLISFDNDKIHNRDVTRMFEGQNGS